MTSDELASETSAVADGGVAVSAAAEPYRADLEAAAQACPGIVTVERLDRLIEASTGWQTGHTVIGVGPVSVAGSGGPQWEVSGGGDLHDVPTGIRNAGALWCDLANTLAAEAVTVSGDVLALAGSDRDGYAAAVGLGAIVIGTKNVRESGVDTDLFPEVKPLMHAVFSPSTPV
ncbi:hypothetical protein [Dietzia sp. 179-F 9C3 NHS]|uniref:hypothetical protein n=1 Tax=Dietzia sp. 179-F 9C3 NHS TaxID=3374295 RepID=UPI00387908C0